MRNDGWYNGYTWKEREAKLKALKNRISKGDHLLPHPPCDLCGDPNVFVEYHDEDYSQPYIWGPPAVFVLCRSCHRDKIHKRFLRPSTWFAFLAHVRRGGYSSDLKNPAIKKEVLNYQAAIDRGEQASLMLLRPYKKEIFKEWFAVLSVDLKTLTSSSARPRP